MGGYNCKPFIYIHKVTLVSGLRLLLAFDCMYRASFHQGLSGLVCCEPAVIIIIQVKPSDRAESHINLWYRYINFKGFSADLNIYPKCIKCVVEHHIYNYSLLFVYKQTSLYFNFGSSTTVKVTRCCHDNVFAFLQYTLVLSQ